MEYKHIEMGISFRFHGDDYRNYESSPRIHGDKLVYHKHRFPIKNGITELEARLKQTKLNIKEAFCHRLCERNK